MSREPGGWRPALLLAVAWAVLPALPALLRGQLLGHPYTDLYPSVWGMWWFAGRQPGLPVLCERLAAPAGMGFYYSSPIHGWAAWPLLHLLGLGDTWNVLVLAARAATVLAAFGAARAWGLERGGALVAAAVYGASPFFQGFAVEGIVEGTDGWTLALWLWALGRRRHLLAAPAFALVVLSSWYMAATGCVLGLLLGPRAWPGVAGGLALSSPALASFLGAFPGRVPLDPAVRRAMGTSLLPGPPGILPGLQPFAMTSWVGLVAPALAALGLRRRRWALVPLAACAVLSLGAGPWYSLPPFSSLRFPYRFHAGTLACLGLLAGAGAQRLGRAGWLAPVVVIEGLLLSPIEPVLPGAPAEVPPIYRDLRGEVLLDVPGPVAMPPGEVNPSRPRARWFLYAQTLHGMATPWAPDFDSVGALGAEDPSLQPIRSLDPLSGLPPPESLDPPAWIDVVVLHLDELGHRAERARALFEAAGWRVRRDDGRRLLMERELPASRGG